MQEKNTRNWREVAERWHNFIETTAGNAFLTYQREHDKAIIADTEMSLQGGNPNDENIRNLHRNAEKALELFVKEIEVLINKPAVPEQSFRQ